MQILVILICTSVVVAAAFLWAFIWSVRSGQYDDAYTPSIRMLFEDKQTPTDTQPKQPKA
jgi:cbb3-type cytochrome oxidase maturation protein